jgi:F-box protein 11
LNYRRNLYQLVYEFDVPLFNPAPCTFEFVSVEESEHANPWKESFRQLYKGVHVRPGYADATSKATSEQVILHPATIDFPKLIFTFTLQLRGRNLTYHNTIQDALEAGDEDVLVFLHAGTYRGEYLCIDSNVTLIGAAPGNVAENVILERDTESTITFSEGAKQAYVGYVTLKFSPDVTSTVPHHKHYCLEIQENCSPTVDHCIIRSTSVGKESIFHKVKNYRAAKYLLSIFCCNTR